MKTPVTLLYVIVMVLQQFSFQLLVESCNSLNIGGLLSLQPTSTKQWGNSFFLKETRDFDFLSFLAEQAMDQLHVWPPSLDHFAIILFLVFDFCRFCVVIRFFKFLLWTFGQKSPWLTVECSLLTREAYTYYSHF